ncbi:hypothetical protein JOE61_000927 [Nocardioides salarius]|uniref:DUF3644 domain-containing protein n=1 Tax=Nocardioides salarius TaxID=374513 RepID=A0ABS2M7D7_9ACTN|nr:DUF3644 domain-containing protein [Nocardioides salarius]MBM7507113.1 hypothetical protein [Nocardioides salarius]
MAARKTRQYVSTAVESLTLAIELFNRPSPMGREHAVVMFAAHAFEMLLKAAIFEKRRNVCFPGTSKSFDLGKCINIAEADLKILDEGDRVLLLALTEVRDTATHDVIAMSEDVLWIHLRSAVTIFRKVLKGLTNQDLTDVMPGRVLPVSVQPPSDVGLVVGKELEQIAAMLGPGKRQRVEAEARLRPLMSLDRAARGEEEAPTKADIDRAVESIKDNATWQTILPGIVGLQLVGGPRSSEQVQEISLKIDPKRGELTVRPAAAGEEAVAYREVDTFDKYNIALNALGPKLGLTQYQGHAVIHVMDLKSDPACYKIRRTKAGNVAFQGLSVIALDRARQAIADGTVVVADAVNAYKARNK